MLRKVSPDGVVTAAHFNALVDAVTQLANIYAAPPLELSKAGGRIGIRLTNSGFMAQITTEIGSGQYTVTEVQPSGSGGWSTFTGGRTVDAYEWDKTTGLPTNRKVWVQSFGNNDWRFYDVNPTGTGITPGCHLDYDGDGKLEVTPDTLIEPHGGLKIIDNDPDCDTLALDLGCHLKFDSLNDYHLAVDTTTLAGQGLEDQAGATTPDCHKLRVKKGCGLKFDADDALAVDLDALVACGGTCGTLTGLQACSAGSSECPCLKVLTGCGLQIDAGTNEVYFDIANVVDTSRGLEIRNDFACPTVAVNYGCGLQIVADQLAFAPFQVAGPGLIQYPADPCQLAVATGCGLEIDLDGKVAVDLPSLINCTGSCGTGTGLTVCTPTAGGCDCLRVNAGCGIYITSDNKVAVGLSDFIKSGSGLKVVTTDGDGNPLPCPVVKVNYGCGLQIVDDELRPAIFQIAGNGLEQNPDDDCEMRVKAGCGILADSNGVSVALSELISQDGDNSCGTASGITFCNPSQGCPFLFVNCGCGLEIVNSSNKVKVKASDLAGEGLQVGDDCQLKLVDGYTCLQVVTDITCNGDGTITVTKKWIKFRGTVSDTNDC